MNNFDEVIEEQEHIQALIHQYVRSLRQLELQKAQLSIRADPSIHSGIEDIRNEINTLNKKYIIMDQLLTKYTLYDVEYATLRRVTPITLETLMKLPKDEFDETIVDSERLRIMGLNDLANKIDTLDKTGNDAVNEVTKLEKEINELKREYRSL